MDTRFHCVYLLTSLDPQCQGDYYIGYTVNPLRRLRQHNGELVNGARRTGRRGRPWTIVCCVSGFTEDRAALKFEWCWQNPTVSARLKHTVGVLKGLRRLPYAVGTLHLLVRAPLFNQLDLTLHVFESDLLHEAQAKAEVFLAMRGGPRPHPATTSPHRSCTEASPTDQASPVVSTQVLNGSSAYGSTASPTSLLLPPLEPSVLFHVEVLTRQRFEDVYLSHDRCLLLPSVGVGGGGSSSFAAEHDGEDSCLSASCPYDVSVLSQAARAEWSNASFDDDAAMAAEGRDQQRRASSDDGGDDTDGDSMTRRFGLRHSPTPSRRPSPCWAEPRGGTPDVMLGYRSEERVGEGNTVELASSPSVSASRASSNPSTVALSSPSHASADVRSATAASVSPSRAPSLPPPSTAVTAEVDAGMRPRIPLRFAHYSDADFAGLHADEQYRLHHGLLPCTLCALPLQPPCVVHCSRAPFCELRCHLSCLAMWMLYEEEGINGATLGSCDEQRRDDTLQQQQQQQQLQHTQPGTPVPFRRLIPSQPCPCPLCGVLLQWGGLIKALKKRVVVEERLQAAQRRTRIEQRWQARLAQINGHRPARGRRSCRRKRPRVDGSTPAPVMAVRPAVSGTSHTTGHNSQPLSAVPSPGAPQLAASPIQVGEVSSLSPIGAPAPPTDASLLSWTAFCEDEWLV